MVNKKLILSAIYDKDMNMYNPTNKIIQTTNKHETCYTTIMKFVIAKNDIICDYIIVLT